MGYLLLNYATRANPPSEANSLLETFQSRKLLADQHAIERKVSMLKKLANKSGGTLEELNEISNRSDISKVLEIYFCRGDYRGGFEAVLKFGNSPTIKSFECLLNDMRIFYEQLPNRSFLCIEKLREEFEGIEENQESWEWLKRLHLIALHLAYNNPAECIEFCTPYLPRLSEGYRVALMAIIVKAYC